MKLHWRACVEPARKDLSERVLADVLAEDDNLHVVFDDSDFVGDLNSRYSIDLAWHMHIATGGVEECSPDHILDIMESPDCNHMIWLSNRAATGPVDRFIWILAHEIQHMNQSRVHPELECAGGLLKLVRHRNAEAPAPHSIEPHELDAEATAFGTLARLLGDTAFDQMVERETRQDGNVGAYYDALRVALEGYDGNWADLTQRKLFINRHGFSNEDLKAHGGASRWEAIWRREAEAQST